MSSTTTSTARKSRTVLSHKQFLAIVTYIREAHAAKPFTSFLDAATAIKQQLGVEASVHSVKVAFEALDIKLASRTDEAKKRDRAQIIASELAALLKELGKEPSQALMSVINRKGL